MATIKAEHSAAQACRMKSDELFWDMHEKCCAQFPNLDNGTRKWLGKYRNRNGTAFLTLPTDKRIAVNKLLNRADKEFNWRMPMLHEGLAAEKQPCQKKDPKLGKPYDAEMKKIAKADACADNAEIAEYWANLLAGYKAFENEKHPPSSMSEDSVERRLACGYACCNELARKGKMPLEIEILYSKINPGFDLVGMWKQKLEAIGHAFSETGQPPNLSHLFYWYYVVSSLHARGALPPEAEWLSENFKLISELNKYLELAHTVGEKIITPNYNIRDTEKWAEWRDEVRQLHLEHKLSPDIVYHFNGCSSILRG